MQTTVDHALGSAVWRLYISKQRVRLPLITNAETTLIFIYLFFVTSLISQADPATFPIMRKF